VAFRKPKCLADYLVREKVSRGCGEDTQRAGGLVDVSQEDVKSV